MTVRAPFPGSRSPPGRSLPARFLRVPGAGGGTRPEKGALRHRLEPPELFRPDLRGRGARPARLLPRVERALSGPAPRKDRARVRRGPPRPRPPGPGGVARGARAPPPGRGRRDLPGGRTDDRPRPHEPVEARGGAARLPERGADRAGCDLRSRGRLAAGQAHAAPGAGQRAVFRAAFPRRGAAAGPRAGARARAKGRSAHGAGDPSPAPSDRAL